MSEVNLSNPPSRVANRLTCVDALRGLVMMFMALDHTREYFGDLRLQPMDLETTTPLLFLTRWITHFCAPTFIFLAGVAAWFYGRKVQEKRTLSWFLLSRGIWLIFLEFTVIYFAWMQSFDIAPLMFIVIAAIGASMIAMSGLIFLPYRVLVIVGVSIVLLHNLLDVYQSDGDFAWLWMFIHESNYYAPWNFVIGYPILSWIGVMILGYTFGPILELNRSSRRRICVVVGFGCCLAFVILRGTNLYGDPSPWTDQETPVLTLFSILNCQKYPPSLAYLLMTLGPTLIVMAALDQTSDLTDSSSTPSILTRLGKAVMNVLLVFGRVPLFFYVVHLYLIHASARLLYWVCRGEPLSPLQTAFNVQFHGKHWPPIYGFELPTVFIAWLVILTLMFPLCVGFGRAKRKGNSRIWSYL